MNKSSQIIGQLQVFARVAQLAVKVFRNFWRNYSVIDISSDKIPVCEATGGYAVPKAPAAGDWENGNDANDVEIKNPEEVETVVETTIPVDSDTETGDKLMMMPYCFDPLGRRQFRVR